MAIIFLDEVIRCMGFGKSSIYKFMAAGTFPSNVPLRETAVGWVSHEIEK